MTASKRSVGERDGGGAVLQQAGHGRTMDKGTNRREDLAIFLAPLPRQPVAAVALRAARTLTTLALPWQGLDRYPMLEARSGEILISPPLLPPILPDISDQRTG
jgi:hypothetical protein